MNVVDRIRIKRNEIETQRAAIQQKMKELESLQLRLTALEEQSAMLDDLLGNEDDTGEANSSKGTGELDVESVFGIRVHPKPQDRLPNPQEAIAALVGNHPEGLTQAEIVDALVGKVKTAAKNPRAVIRNIVHYMVGKEQLKKTENGLLLPPA